MDGRNVIDMYKYWPHEKIVNDLKLKRRPFISVFEHINGDFNKASGIRNHNAFLGSDIYIVGPRARRYDKRGTVGTHHYENVIYVDSIDHLIDTMSVDVACSYRWVGVDNVESSESIYDFVFPADTVMCFGEEGRGISDELLEWCDHKVYIPQQGSVRSLNVGTASGIAMYEYSRQFQNN